MCTSNQHSRPVGFHLAFLLTLVLFCQPLFAADKSTVESTNGDEVSLEATVESASQVENVETDKVKKKKEESTDSLNAASLSSMSISSLSGTSESGGGDISQMAINVTQSYGTAVARIPIVVPPGRAGGSPSIALIYSSTNKNSWIGVGWDLDIGSISRSTRHGIDYSAYDFVVNGEDLVSRQEWGTGYYGKKTEGEFTKYFFNSATNGWEVTTKVGQKLYYGSTSASRQDNSQGVFKWCLDRVEDSNGNFMDISYVKPEYAVNGQIYPDRIDYTGHGTGTPAVNYVKFYLESRTDITPTYSADFEVRTKYRLHTIDVVANGNRSRTYRLNYTSSNSSSRSLLSMVEQFGADATIDTIGDIIDGTLLPPISVNYDSTNNDFGQTNYSNFGELGWADRGYNNRIHLGDFNGDGKTDVLLGPDPNGQWRMRYSTGTDWTYVNFDNFGDLGWASTTYNNRIHLGDFNGDGKTDVLLGPASDGQWRMRYSTGTDWTYVNFDNFGDLGWAYRNYNNRIHLGDFNGDGKTDVLLGPDPNGQWRMRYSTGTDWTYVNFDNFGDLGWASTTYSNRIHLSDFNGDGKTDILLGPDPNGQWRMRYSTGTDWVFVNFDSFAELEWASRSYNNRIHLGDFNGDGKTDVLLGPDPNGQWRVRYFTGNDWTSANFENFAELDWASRSYNNRIHLGDFNGDGKTDVLLGPDPNGQWRVRYFSDNNWTFVNFDNFADLGWAFNTYNNRIHPCDFNGDGKTDILLGPDPNGQWRGKNSVSGSDRVVSIDNEHGSTITIEYTPSSAFSNHLLPFIVHPVTRMTQDNGTGVVSATNYTYSGGLFNFPNREFRGFETVIVTNPDGTTVETDFHQGEFRKGLQKEVRVKEPDETLMSKTIYNWEEEFLDAPENKVAFVKLSQQRIEDYDGTTVFTQTDNTDYDSTNGNLRISITSGTDAETITKTNQYVNKGDWVWRLAQETIEGSTSGKVREVYYDYEANTGNLLSKTFWLQDGANPVIQYTYDSYGNLKTETDPLGRVTATDYETVAHTYPKKVTAPATSGVSHILENIAFDYRFGKVTQTRDENNNITTYSYDEFGRLEQVDLPNGGQTITEYYDNASPRYVVNKVKENGAGGTIDSYTYFDGFSREIQSVTFGEAAKTIVTRTYYDDMGRKNRSTGPFFGSGSSYPQAEPAQYPYQEIEFDFRGRPKTVTSPDSQHTTVQASFSYNGLSVTVTDPDGKQKKEKKDYLGRLVQVTEYGDDGEYLTTYTYNAAGDLKTVIDHQGHITTINYDTLGRKKGMIDPDMGIWSYTYDAAGNLKTQTDAKGQVITFDYDELNRILAKTYSTSDPAVTYTYDNLSITNGRGQLYSETNGSVTTTYDAYDSMGNATSVTKTIVGNPNSYTTQFIYDVAGRMTTTIYPDTYQVTNTFHPGTSLLFRVTGSDNTVFAEMVAYEPTGKIGQIDHANGTSTVYSYDPLSTRLLSLSTVGSSGVLQDRNYMYSEAGDITSITDALRSVTLSYTYDNLHRLTGESSGGVYPAAVYTYDAIGNMMTKAVGSSSLSYQYTGAQAHAVNQITFNGNGYTYTYDDNGNMTAGPDFTDPANIATRTITYNADNMPTHLVHTRGGTTVTTDITYGGSGTRAKKTVSGGTTTYYIGSHFEIEGGFATRYIFAGNLRVAKVSAAGTNYFHKDHLGSSTVMTDNAGVSVETAEYLPYGAIRLQIGVSVTNYMFTDQEQDSETGLYNYNARLYDPIIGRFIAADAVVPDFMNPQSLNRYSYCINNPLVYIDPSGHDFGLTAIIAGAIIGAISAGAQSDWNPEAMLVGAVIGGISGGAGSWVSGVSNTVLGGMAAGATAGGLNAAYYGGDIIKGVGEGGIWGAIGGAAFGTISNIYGDAWSLGRIAAHGVVGGGLAEMQGGDFSLGFAMSAGSAFGMKLWEISKEITDKHYLEECRSRKANPISDHGLYRTDGESNNIIGKVEKGNLLKDLGIPHMDPQGTRLHDYDKGWTRIARQFIIETSKFHDAGNSWGYESGAFKNTSYGFNTIHGIFSGATMIPAAALTGFAHSALSYQPVVYTH